MKKKSAIFLAVILTLGLTACSSKGDSAENAGAGGETNEVSGETEASGEAIELTYWYWADTTEQSDLMKSIVAEYNATNTMNVTVHAEENAWNGGAYVEDMYVAVAGGGGPDISTFRISGASMFHNGGYLYNCTDLVNGWEDKGALADSIWESISESTGTPGEYYSVPWTYETLYVYYRPSMFEELNIKVPETYEEFMTAIEKCTQDTDGDGKTDVYGLSLRGPGGQEPWYYWLYANGATFDDLTSEAAVKGMEAYKSIYTNGWAPETAPTDAYSEIMANFKSGRAAMVIHHVGSSVDMTDTFGEDVAAFTLPASAAGNGWDALCDTELVIMSSTKHPEAAFDFAKFMATGKGQEMWFEGTRKCNLNEKISAREDFQNNQFLKTSLEGLDHAGMFPFTPHCSEFISTTWASITQRILLDQLSVEDGMQEYKTALYGE